MKFSALACLIIVIMATLTSFYLPAEETYPMPVAVKEARPTPLPYSLPLQYATWTIYYADETGVPVWLAARLFDVESDWTSRARSPAGALGLAQLMPGNLDMFADAFNDGRPVDPFDPLTSIRVGLRYLAYLYAVTGSWRMAVMAYNGGLGRWLNPRRWGGWPAESVEYAKAILGG